MPLFLVAMGISSVHVEVYLNLFCLLFLWLPMNRYELPVRIHLPNPALEPSRLVL